MENLMIVLGNFFSFLGCCCIIGGTLAKNYKKTMFWQTIDASCFTVSNILLQGWSGVITNAVAAIRSLFCYKGEPQKIIKVVFIVLTFILGLIFKDKEWYGILPIIASTTCAIVILSTQNIIIGELLGNKLPSFLLQSPLR